MAHHRRKDRLLPSLPLLLAALLAALLAGSCGLLRPSGRLLVLTDPATRILMEQGGLGEPALKRLAARRGLALQVLSAPAPLEAEPLLRGVARQARPRQVLLLTPFPVDAEGLAAEFPRTVFIRLSSAAAGEGRLPPNWITVRFDRAAAFRRAGELVGGLPPGRREAAIVLGDAGPRSTAEAAAFREGFSGTGDPSLLVERDLQERSGGREGGGPADDPQGVRKLVEELHQEGVRVFLLKAYAANAAALETVAALGAAAVVEDWQAARVRPEAVLLSVECDLREALGRALDRAADPTAGADGAAVEGPVRLVRGGAMPEETLPLEDSPGP